MYRKPQGGMAEAAWRRHSPSTYFTADLYLQCIKKVNKKLINQQERKLNTKQRAEAHLGKERSRNTQFSEKNHSVIKIEHFRIFGNPPAFSMALRNHLPQKQLHFGNNSELCDILTCPTPSPQLHSSLEN